MTIRILLLEDSDLDAELIAGHLRKGHVAHEIRRVTTREDYVAALSGEYDLILADYSLPSFDGLPLGVALICWTTRLLLAG